MSKKRKHIIVPPFITILQLTIAKSNCFQIGTSCENGNKGEYQ
nr:MAG TPA: hypothetical protein [Caudoviricetes sp.]